MPITRSELEGMMLADGDVVGTDGDRIGGIGQIYCDDSTGEPAWVTAKTGLFGISESFVPLEGASLSGGNIVVGYDKDTVKDAPRIDDDGSLSEGDEQALYDYYRVGGTTADHERADAGTADIETTPDSLDDNADDTVGRDTSGRATEERLDVGTGTQQTGRARLRKYVVTEEVTVTVPVSHEEIRVEHEPIDDAPSDPSSSEEEDEVILYEERPVVQMETVPVERVGLVTDTVAEQANESDVVRTEARDTDLDVDDTATRRN